MKKVVKEERESDTKIRGEEQARQRDTASVSVGRVGDCPSDGGQSRASLAGVGRRQGRRGGKADHPGLTYSFLLRVRGEATGEAGRRPGLLLSTL